MSAQYYAELYAWLQDAYESALQLSQPHLALQYITLMRAMEASGVVKVEAPTIN